MLWIDRLNNAYRCYNWYWNFRCYSNSFDSDGISVRSFMCLNMKEIERNIWELKRYVIELFSFFVNNPEILNSKLYNFLNAFLQRFTNYQITITKFLSIEDVLFVIYLLKCNHLQFVTIYWLIYLQLVKFRQKRLEIPFWRMIYLTVQCQ